MLTGWWCNNHLKKYEFVNGKDDSPYMKWKIKFMFQTTNQKELKAIGTAILWIDHCAPEFSEPNVPFGDQLMDTVCDFCWISKRIGDDEIAKIKHEILHIFAPNSFCETSETASKSSNSKGSEFQNNSTMCAVSMFSTRWKPWNWTGDVQVQDWWQIMIRIDWWKHN